MAQPAPDDFGEDESAAEREALLAVEEEFGRLLAEISTGASTSFVNLNGSSSSHNGTSSSSSSDPSTNGVHE